jgi:hypothetical protein
VSIIYSSIRTSHAHVKFVQVNAIRIRDFAENLPFLKSSFAMHTLTLFIDLNYDIQSIDL